MHNLCLIMLATNTIFIDLLHITIQELNVQFQPQDFFSKGRKSANNA